MAMKRMRRRSRVYGAPLETPGQICNRSTTGRPKVALFNWPGLPDSDRSAALEAFFGCVYYAAMRPGEVRNLREADLGLPETGWGQAILHGSYQDSGKAWTDDGELGEERALKHRVRTATREVPLAPQLVALLRAHLAEFGTASGWLFVTRSGPLGRPIQGHLARPVPLSTVNRTLKAARAKAFSEAEQRSPLVQRTYDLRHAAVSTWLAAGVPPTQVAKWAGHSVAVLLRVYAHAVDGQADLARRRIEEALAEDVGDESSGVTSSGATHARTDLDDRY